MKPQKIRLEKIEKFFLPKAVWRLCPDCQSEQIFISAERATFVSSLTTREIFRLVEAEKIHFFESEDGFTLLCTKSMMSFLPTESFNFAFQQKFLEGDDQ